MVHIIFTISMDGSTNYQTIPNIWRERICDKIMKYLNIIFFRDKISFFKKVFKS
jgi:hypothetical protein